jgi:hypothetical protein
MSIQAQLAVVREIRAELQKERAKSRSTQYAKVVDHGR